MLLDLPVLKSLVHQQQRIEVAKITVTKAVVLTETLTEGQPGSGANFAIELCVVPATEKSEPGKAYARRAMAPGGKELG